MASLLGIAMALLFASCCFAEPSDLDKLAGKTVEQHSAHLDDSDRTVRLRAAKSLASMGQAAGTTLSEALNHDDSAVRYIAATGLGRMGGKALEVSRESLEKLIDDQRSHAVRMAASFALCRLDANAEHLSVLIDALSHNERGIVCAAAELLGDIGPYAKDAIEPLVAIHAKHKWGVKGGDYHIGGAAMNALRRIDPEHFE